MATKDPSELSRLFRMAVVTGVESAVQIHIDRGDDLNARDEKGQTPLMLSAARNKAAICRLLLVAGADANLLDPLGRSALSIAKAVGAIEVASAIEAALLPMPSESDGAANAQSGQVTDEASEAKLADAEFDKFPADVQAPTQRTRVPGTPSAVGEEDSIFDLSKWEVEEDRAPPQGDPALAMAAFLAQGAITKHQPIDTSEDWGDLEVFLPDKATPLPRTEDVEARERLRLILLRAIREGSVPLAAIEDLTLGDDGAPNAEASALLSMVINDLAAETDERFEYSTLSESFTVFVDPYENADEEEAVAEALAFLDDLASGRNEPLRIYQREFQREPLLTAEAEVVLGQAMERDLEKALDALAAWPTGMAATLEAARQVGKGTRPLRSMSSGPQVEPLDARSTGTSEYEEGRILGTVLETATAEPESGSIEVERDSEFDPNDYEFEDGLAEFCANAELLSSLQVSSRQCGSEWEACRHVLDSLALTRAFLMELADSGLVGEPESAHAFGQAIRAYLRARDRMVVANLKLVFSIAKKYQFSGQPLDDLLQEGNIGLIRAVDRYDWRKGFKFSTYATWWIRQCVGRFVADKSKTIRLPVHVYEKTQRIAQVARDFELRHGREPTLEEHAALIGMPVHKVVALSRMVLDPFPLHELPEIDDRISVDAKDEFAIRDPREYVEDSQLSASVDHLLSTLTLKEEIVLRMRLGLGVQDSMTLEEIGAQFDVTRERIRQIEAKALGRLRHPVRLHRFLHEVGIAASKIYEQSSSESESDPTASAAAAQRFDPMPTTIEKLLREAHDLGIDVGNYLDGNARELWDRIANSSDSQSVKLARRLILLGFEYWQGKGVEQ